EAGRPSPWRVGDAPGGFIDGQLRAIVGGEVAIATVEGKEKLSQNRDAEDRAGALDGLRPEPGPGPGASADLMIRLPPPRRCSRSPAVEPAQAASAGSGPGSAGSSVRGQPSGNGGIGRPPHAAAIVSPMALSCATCSGVSPSNSDVRTCSTCPGAAAASAA